MQLATLNARHHDTPPAPPDDATDGLRSEAGAAAQMECMLRDLRRVYQERNEALQFRPGAGGDLPRPGGAMIGLRDRVNRLQASFPDLLEGPPALQRGPAEGAFE